MGHDCDLRSWLEHRDCACPAQGKLHASESISLLAAFGAFMAVGSLVVARRPNNVIGWAFSAVGLLAATGAVAEEYAEYAYVTEPGALPGAVAAAWYANWSWFPTIFLAMLFPLLFFPNGRLLSARWRPAFWIGATAAVALTMLAALEPWLQGEDITVRNPLGIRGVPDAEEGAVATFLLGLVTLVLIAALASLVIRFRRSRGDERQQLKWFTYAGSLMVTSLILEEGFRLDLPTFVFGFMVSLVPISAGIAILKYRLYDIDFIINRTMVYVSLTAVLALIYAGGVVGVGSVVRRATGQERNSLVVAASTLAVAGLFRPARARIQGFIDRRFYRSKFDAQQALADFSAKMRDEIDLDSLTGELTAVVRDTVQPTHVSLWLRP